MSEEVRNASTDVARSMLLSLLINGCLAFGMLCAILLSAPGLMELPATEPPSFVGVFVDAVGSTAGATVMTSIIIALEFCSALGCLAAASRMTWSFARDRGLPFARFISMVFICRSCILPYADWVADRPAHHHPSDSDRSSHHLFGDPRPHQSR